MEIFTTRDYDRFKVIMSNREVDMVHVRRLSKSIRRKNLLYIRPVIVNSDMQIIDGQHRVEACRLIGEWVHYIKVDNLGKEDIAVLNTAQKNWRLMDFINFFAIEGNKDFIELSKAINQFPGIKISLILRLLGDRRSLRDGRINISNLSNVKRLCTWINQLRNKGYEFVMERAFGLALYHSVNRQDEFEVLLNAVQSDVFYKCHSDKEYERMIRKLI